MRKILVVLVLLVLVIAPASAEAYFNPTYFAYMHFTNGTDIPDTYILGSSNIEIKVDPVPIAPDLIGKMRTAWCSDPNDRTTCGLQYAHNQNWWNTYATLSTDTYKTSDPVSNTSERHYYTAFFVDDGYEGSNVFADITLMYITRNSTIPSGPPTPIYRCNFPYSTGDNPSGVYVQSPFSLACTQPDASIITQNNASLIHSLIQDGWYGLGFRVCNAQGCNYLNTTTLVNASATPPPETGINFRVNTVDPLTGATVASWRSTTTLRGTSTTSHSRGGAHILTTGDTPGTHHRSPRA